MNSLQPTQTPEPEVLSDIRFPRERLRRLTDECLDTMRELDDKHSSALPGGFRRALQQAREAMDSLSIAFVDDFPTREETENLLRTFKGGPFYPSEAELAKLPTRAELERFAAPQDGEAP